MYVYYSGCDSDATSNKIVAMEKRYYYEVIAFLSRRYFVFSSCCLVILIIYFYDFRWQLLSDDSDIARKLKLELWVTSLSDTPRLQYYDVQTIFLHAHLQAVYYNCVKFHLNPMSRLGGVALTSPSLYTERIFVFQEYKLNYSPFQILDSNHIPSCTSAGSVLQLCKVS